MPRMSKNFTLSLLCALILTASLAGCAGSKYYKGLLPDGQKAYLGPVPIENSDAYKEFLTSPKTEVDKQRYLFARLKASENLQFYHDGNWYNAVEAYRGGMWLMRNRYKKGQDTREFIRKYIERSDAGNLHLVKYPDDSLQIGSYVLYNELDALESALKK